MAAKEVPRSALKFVVFLGTVREGNLGSRAGKFMVRKLNEKGFQVNFLGKPTNQIALRVARLGNYQSSKVRDDRPAASQ